MEDLSHLAVNSMWATNQHSGNRPSDQTVAMSAPGSPSPAVDEGAGGVAGGDDVARQPFTVPAACDGRRLVHGSGS